jgi:hypothetical protein
MMVRTHTRDVERGLSLIGFLFVIVIVALLAVLGLKVVPTVVEYAAIKKAIVTARNSGTTAREIQDSFEKQRTTAYIDSVSGKDLEIIKTGDGFDVSVEYEKRIPLVGPASLVIDYAATTGKGPAGKAAQ